MSVAEAAGAAGTVLPGAEDAVTGAGLGVATKSSGTPGPSPGRDVDHISTSTSTDSRDAVFTGRRVILVRGVFRQVRTAPGGLPPAKGSRGAPAWPRRMRGGGRRAGHRAAGCFAGEDDRWLAADGQPRAGRLAVCSRVAAWLPAASAFDWPPRLVRGLAGLGRWYRAGRGAGVAATGRSASRRRQPARSWRGGGAGPRPVPGWPAARRLPTPQRGYLRRPRDRRV